MTALRPGNTNGMLSLSAGCSGSNPGFLPGSGAVPGLLPNSEAMSGFLPAGTSRPGGSLASLTSDSRGMALFREPPSWPMSRLDLEVVEGEVEPIDTSGSLLMGHFQPAIQQRTSHSSPVESREHLDATLAARLDNIERMAKDALEHSKLAGQRDSEQLLLRHRFDALEAAVKEDLAQERQARHGAMQELAEKLSLEMRARQGQRASMNEMLDAERQEQEDRMVGHARQMDALTNRVREIERIARDYAVLQQRMMSIENALKETSDKLSSFSGAHEAQKLRLQSTQDRLGAVEVKADNHGGLSHGQLEDSMRSSHASLQMLNARLSEVEGACGAFVAVQREVLELKQRFAQHDQLGVQVSGFHTKLEELDQALRRMHASTAHVTELMAKERNARELQVKQYSEALRKEIDRREAGGTGVASRLEKLEHEVRRASALLNMDCSQISQQTQQLADRLNIVLESSTTPGKATIQSGEDANNKMLMSGYQGQFQGFREAYVSFAPQHGAMEDSVAVVEESGKDFRNVQPHGNDEAAQAVVVPVQSVGRQPSNSMALGPVPTAASPASAVATSQPVCTQSQPSAQIRQEPRDTQRGSTRAVSPVNCHPLEESRIHRVAPDSPRNRSSVCLSPTAVQRGRSSAWPPASPQRSPSRPASPYRQESPPAISGTTLLMLPSTATLAGTAGSLPQKAMTASSASLRASAVSGSFATGSPPFGRAVVRSCSGSPKPMVQVAGSPVLVCKEKPPVVLTPLAPASVRIASPAPRGSVRLASPAPRASVCLATPAVLG